MPKIRKRVGRSKEAQLVVLGSKVVGEQQYKKTLTQSEAEYIRYSELLQGFFQKITRWQKIAQAKEYQENERFRGFSIFNSDNNLSIQPGTTWKGDDPPDKAAQVRN